MVKVKALIIGKRSFEHTNLDSLQGALQTQLLNVIEVRYARIATSPIKNAIKNQATGFSGLIATFGGIDYKPRHIIPCVCEKLVTYRVVGIEEFIRGLSESYRFYRGVAGVVKGGALLVNFPEVDNGGVTLLNELACVADKFVREHLHGS